MTSLPPRPPPADARDAAFSVRDLRANLESRARDLETRASDARAAMRQRLLTASQGFVPARGGEPEAKIPSATHLVELAREPARKMADTVARLAPEDNALIRGMKTGMSAAATGVRRARAADEPLRSSVKVALPEWDVFKSLKTGATEKRATRAAPRRARVRAAAAPAQRRELGRLAAHHRGKIEEKIGAAFPPRRTAKPPRRAMAPSELLSKVQDAGNAAVREWMAAAREKAEAAALENKSRRPLAGKRSTFSRAASMTEAEFAEAEAAAAAMERRIEEMAGDVYGDANDSPETETSETETPETETETAAATTTARDDARRESSLDANGASSRFSNEAPVFRAPRTPVERASIDEKKKRKSLRDPGRSVAIVTTASLPWMTGTAVNPLLRAAYLAKRGAHDVTLVVPWLPPAEQALIHPSVIFQTPEAQAAYVRQWVQDRCGFSPTNMKLDFYPGRYATDKYSIIPVGDVSAYITSPKRRDVAILEEPEHLNWYHSGGRWSDTFEHVVGVVHTNYLEDARLEQHGEVKEAAMRFVNSWVSRMHCHKIIKLSDAVQDFPRSQTMNVHGVSPVFLEVGRRKATAAAQARAAEADPDAAAAQAVGHTVGRALASLGARAERAGAGSERSESGIAAFAEAVHPSREVFTKGATSSAGGVGQGFHELLQCVEEHNASASGASFPLEMDVFGSGEDFSDVSSTSAAKRLPLTFKGRADHASDQMHDYKVFVNPSLSDVVATTTAEALAMGKFAIVAQHPSNAFFSTFPNCLVYSSPGEFSACVEKALSSDPAPLSVRDRYRLSWEAATDRFLDAAELGGEQSAGPGSGRADRIAEAAAHALPRRAG